ncbi:WhiB family transcriptional regulator [Embleya sp. NPDC050154]|uniref:WhiB family transcriptional regulator n=1 Tax=Embleya sp. NPDC050154 TaxID=3363988 RepID=UPI00378CC807
MTTKTCTKCKRALPPDHFNRNSSRRDGLRSSCRVCQPTDGLGPAKPKPAPKPPKKGAGGREVRFEIAPTHEWILAAACRDMDPDLFCATGLPDPRVVAACKRCPIREMCLEEELRLNPTCSSEQIGYRGGTTAVERGRIIRERKAAAKAERDAAKSTAA